MTRPKSPYAQKRVHVYLPEPQIKLLREISHKSHLSMAEHLRRAVDGYTQFQGARYDLVKPPEKKP